MDIDGTLTNEPSRPWGKVNVRRLHKIQDLIASGRQVVIWSGNGTAYAREFAMCYGLAGAVAIGKPEVMVDDNPTIRPANRMPVVSPETYFRDET